jgi:hypothetical protein
VRVFIVPPVHKYFGKTVKCVTGMSKDNVDVEKQNKEAGLASLNAI